jgi:dedicator of cytokinesis protein 3
MRAYFVAQLRSVFETSPEIDLSFNKSIATFLDSLELFLDLLLCLRDLPETLEWKDERATAVYRLMQFTQHSGRQDLYTRFLYQLIAIGEESDDGYSAGMCLQLHADLFEWNVIGDMVTSFEAGKLFLPPQNAFARKEALLYHAINYFSRFLVESRLIHTAEAEAYENVLELCQELTTQHQRVTFDVNKLSELLMHQARLWEKIAQSHRPKIEYFRVVSRAVTSADID